VKQQMLFSSRLSWLALAKFGMAKSKIFFGPEQWFLTFFTSLSLLSNKITGFTPNTLNGVIY